MLLLKHMYLSSSKISLFFIILIPFLGISQEVQISQEFSIRNDYNYNILGRVNDHILLMRDRGFTKELEVFDNELKHLDTKELIFKRRKLNVIGTVTRDSFFTVYYTYRDEGQIWVRARNFDSWGNTIDTSLIANFAISRGISYPQFHTSKDKKSSVIYSFTNSDRLNVLVVNNDSLKTIWDDEILFDNFDLSNDFKSIVLTNKSEVFVLLDNNNYRRKKDDHNLVMTYLPPESELVIQHLISLKDKLTTDVKLSFDEVNQQVCLVGLFGTKNNQDAEGYFFSITPMFSIQENIRVQFRQFTSEFVASVYGLQRSKERSLKYYRIKDVLLRHDGGFMIQTEMHKSYSRGTRYNPTFYRNDIQNQGGWTDYYHEDMVFISVDPDGEELWKDIFHKKQFSQDDDGIFSSFFTFVSPSMIRILYNDEIKKNNTVSEYVVNPVGVNKRKSVLSTDNQGLSLRFKDALQISNNEIIVPSERSFGLNLVKISY